MSDSRSKDSLWDAADVAAFLKVAEGTVKQWAKTGRGPRVVKVEGQNRYRPSDVYEYVEEQTRLAAANE